MSLTKSKLFSGYIVRFVKNYVAYASTSSSYLHVETCSVSGISKISFNKPPVNTLNTDMFGQIKNSIIELEKENCRGLIITSDLPKIFCGGLDLLELYNPEPEKLKLFWSTFQEAWSLLYMTSFPTVAVINGHSPAGGCLLAMSCEYRIMLGPKYQIGLNETKLGITAPFWFMDVMKETIGARQTELALTLGSLFSPAEALSIHLIDETYDDIDQCFKRAHEFLEIQMKIDRRAREITKRTFRQPLMANFMRQKENDLHYVVKSILAPEVQKKLQVYLENMKRKS